LLRKIEPIETVGKFTWILAAPLDEDWTTPKKLLKPEEIAWLEAYFMVRKMSRPIPLTVAGWFTTRNLPHPDFIKLHGEWDRVRLTVALVLASCLWVLVISVVILGVLGRLQKQR
jgi:hypothetical protein